MVRSRLLLVVSVLLASVLPSCRVSHWLFLPMIIS